MKLLSAMFVSGLAKICNHRHFSQLTHARTMALDSAELTVGGYKFTLASNEVKQLSPQFAEELATNNNAITLDRDGQLFRHVNAFLVNGQLPRDANGQHSLDEDTLDSLKIEANFFGIPSLVEECNAEHRLNSTNDPVTSYMTIRKFIQQSSYQQSTLDVVYEPTPLLAALDEFWSPFCLTGNLSSFYTGKDTLFKSSTIHNLQLDELIAAATQSPFGRGTQTVVDTTVRNSFEIPAANLRLKALDAIADRIDISDLSRTQELALKPYKLVIYKEGGHFHEHRDTVRGEGHIGTLVVVLNSEYTGGELEVTHGGRTETVTGAYSWVAMYGDCLHKINPVTSGTRVSLIYDIYASSKEAGFFGDRERSKYDCAYNDNIDNDWRKTGPPLFQRKVDSYKSYCDYSIENVRGVSGDLGELIDAELADADSLIVTLQHLYPECQTNPAFLKGGDRALYDLLRQHYDLRVVAATIRRYWYFVTKPPDIHGTLFAGGFEHSDPSKKVKVYIPHALSRESVLDYTPYISHTGNEAQAEDTHYIVAGLQLRKRVKPCAFFVLISLLHPYVV